MKHMKVITRKPAAAQDLTLTEILEILVSVFEALEPILNKEETTV